MLLNLTILDLAVVDSLNLDLRSGMSVLTGETGAGKSILLTALGLALGDRADSGYVRPNCKRAEINLEFDLADSPLARQWLIDNELDDEDLCLIRRTVSDDGRSKAYINNRPVNLQTLQSLSRLLVEIHGQHAHLTLLDRDQQRVLLDQFARHDALLSDVAHYYSSWRETDKQLQQLLKIGTDQTQREELLRYQLEELQQLNLAEFDYQALADEHHKLANIGKILSSGQQQLDALYENDEHALSDRLAQIIHQLSELGEYAHELNDIVGLLNEAEIQINEASQQLRRFLDHQDTDPQQLQELEQQLLVIQQLSRKHRVQPPELPALAAQLATELDSISHSSERIEQLTQDSQCLLEQYRQAAAQLSDSRQQAASQLQQRISVVLKELGLQHGEFSVQMRDLDTAQRHGVDDIEFLISTNPGLPAKPLSKIASGGELSRISLAIQVTTSSDKTTPTMIFDEVDSGIGGGIAEIVGQKLRRLSQNRQVLTVTHLPQVAAQAHQHLFVAKNQDRDVTASTVTYLNEEQRVQEIARMLGGVTLTTNTLNHAHEMLESAQKNM